MNISKAILVIDAASGMGLEQVNVHVLTADLSQDNATKKIYNACQEQNIEVYALINNACCDCQLSLTLTLES